MKVVNLMYDQVIKLVAETKAIDKHGDIVASVPIEREVFAEIKSIVQSEFYQAHAVGIRPEVKFVLPDYLEYKNERIVKYQGFAEDKEAEYSVIRTYKTGNELELVCERRVD